VAINTFSNCQMSHFLLFFLQKVSIQFFLPFSKRFFSAESSRRLFSDILKENSGTILALGAIGSGSFAIGFYVNQMRAFEEKLNAIRMIAKKDTLLAEEKARKDVMEAKKEALQLLYNIFTQEEFNNAKKKLMAQKDKSVYIE
jgi:hypothetical protein